MTLRDSLTRNWPLKLTSLTLAVVLWVMATGEEPATATVPVRIAVQTPPGRTLLHPPAQVSAIVSGPRADLFRTASEELVVIRTVPDTATRRFELEIGPSDVDLPPGLEVRVHDVYPRRLVLQLDVVESRRVPVRPLLAQPADSGLTTGGRLRVEPATVAVTGPSELVRRTDTLHTLPIALESEGHHEQRVRIDTVGLGGLRVDPAVVTVAADVQRSAERVFDRVPVHLAGGLADSLALTEAHATVVVRGDAARTAALTADSIFVAATRESGDTARLRVVAPHGLTTEVRPLRVPLVTRTP